MSSICVFHTDRAASARCCVCHKPICSECIVRQGGAVYCSSVCVERESKFYARYASDQPGLLARLAGWLKTLLGLAVVVVILIVMGAKLLQLPFCVAILKQFGF